MPLDLKALSKNQTALVGIAAAGALGLFVWAKNRGTSPAASTGNTAGTTANTTGTDMASWLSQYGQQLTDAITALQKAQTNTGNAGVGQGATTGSPVILVPVKSPIGGGYAGGNAQSSAGLSDTTPPYAMHR